MARTPRAITRLTLRLPVSVCDSAIAKLSSLRFTSDGSRAMLLTAAITLGVGRGWAGVIKARTPWIIVITEAKNKAMKTSLEIVFICLLAPRRQGPSNTGVNCRARF